MFKNSQLTIFMILGIMLVLILIILIAGNDRFITLNKTSGEKFKPIESMINTCINKIAQDTLFTIAKNGGFKNPDPNTLFDDEVLAVHYQPNENLVPSVYEVEFEIASLMDENLALCSAKLRLLSEYGYEIDIDAPVSEVIIRDEEVLFKIKYPVRATLGKQEIVYDFFSTRVKISFQPFLRLSMLAAQETIQDPKTLCLSCIFEFGQQNGLMVNIQNIGDYRLLYSVWSKNSTLNYRFSHKYK